MRPAPKTISAPDTKVRENKFPIMAGSQLPDVSLSVGNETPADIHLKVLDTNILVYALQSGGDVRCQTAQKLVRELTAPDSVYAMPVQTLAELYQVMRSKYNNPILLKSCADFIDNIVVLRTVEKISYSEHTLLSAMRLSQAHNLHFWDCLIAACMLEHGVKIIYTENVKDFSGIAGIQAINPFSSK